MWYIYATEQYSSIKKKKNNAICRNRDGTKDSHTKLSMFFSEREKQIPYDITCMLNLKYGTKEPIYRKRTTTKLIDMENRLVVVKGEGSGLDCEFGVGTWKLSHLEWIGNEILLCSTGNCIQSLVMEKKKMYVYVSLAHFAIQEKLTDYCKSIIIKNFK